MFNYFLPSLTLPPSLQLGGGLFGQKTQQSVGLGLGTGLGGLGGTTSLGGGLGKSDLYDVWVIEVSLIPPLSGLGGLQTSQSGGLGGGLFNKGLVGGLGQTGGLGTSLGMLV